MYFRHQSDPPLQLYLQKDDTTVNQFCWAGQDDHCQFFLYQILRGMKYVHSAQAARCKGLGMVLLMAEILRSPVELGSFSQYLSGFIHPRWCRISAINSKNGTLPKLTNRPSNMVVGRRLSFWVSAYFQGLC